MSDRNSIGNHRAPSHHKPKLPRLEVVAERLRAGELLEDIATQYGRVAESLAQKLNYAGWGRDGKVTRHEPSTRSMFLAKPTPEFLDDAICATTDPVIFFPEQGDPGGYKRQAKAVCARCGVRLECLRWALSNEERWGIWGGTTPRERKRLRKTA